MEKLNPAMCIGLNASHLCKVGTSEFLAEKEAGEAFLNLQAGAKSGGLDIEIVSAFRSFDRQCAIFDAKWQGKRPVLDAKEHPIDISSFNPQEKVAAICHFSAIPGFSRHHFGTDFDIYSPTLLPSGEKLKLTAYEYALGSYFYPLELWLKDNLEHFGFTRPYSGKEAMGYEPWHISYKKSADKFLREFSLDFVIDYLLKTDFAWAHECVRYAKNNYKTMLCL